MHALTLQGHLRIRTQQVQTYPKGLRVHLTSLSREGAPHDRPRHMNTTHQSSKSTVPQASRSARALRLAPRLSTFQAHTNCRCRRMMSQIRVQIPMAILPLPLRSLRQDRFNCPKHNRRLALVPRPTIKAMTRCFTPTEHPTTHTTNTITTNEAQLLSDPPIMALEAGPHTVASMVAAQDTPPPIIPRSLGQA